MNSSNQIFGESIADEHADDWLELLRHGNHITSSQKTDFISVMGLILSRMKFSLGEYGRCEKRLSALNGLLYENVNYMGNKTLKRIRLKSASNMVYLNTDKLKKGLH